MISVVKTRVQNRGQISFTSENIRIDFQYCIWCDMMMIYLYILDSERNDELCIDFTMMCDLKLFLFWRLHVFTISSRNNALIFNFGIYSGEKVNLVGAIGRSK